jgi:hypothetical protein
VLLGFAGMELEVNIRLQRGAVKQAAAINLQVFTNDNHICKKNSEGLFFLFMHRILR